MINVDGGVAAKIRPKFKRSVLRASLRSMCASFVLRRVSDISIKWQRRRESRDDAVEACQCNLADSVFSAAEGQNRNRPLGL